MCILWLTLSSSRPTFSTRSLWLCSPMRSQPLLVGSFPSILRRPSSENRFFRLCRSRATFCQCRFRQFWTQTMSHLVQSLQRTFLAERIHHPCTLPYLTRHSRSNSQSRLRGQSSSNLLVSCGARSQLFATHMLRTPLTLSERDRTRRSSFPLSGCSDVFSAMPFWGPRATFLVNVSVLPSSAPTPHLLLAERAEQEHRSVDQVRGWRPRGRGPL